MNYIKAVIIVSIIFGSSFFPLAKASEEIDPVSLYLKASSLEESGNYAAAAEIILNLIKSDKSAHLYSKLAELYLASGNQEKAFDTISDAEKAFPKDASFKFLMGQLSEFYKRNPKDALAFYKEAIKLSDEPKYSLAAARCSESMKEYSEAIDILSSMIKKEPKQSLYYSERGRVYHNMGKIDNAIKDLTKAIDINGDMPSMLRLADIYLAQKDNEKAKKILERISVASDGMVIPELKLGEIYQNEKDFDKAIELYSNIADKLSGKDRAAVLKQLGSIQYQIGDYDNASRSFEWVTELIPEDSMSAFVAGYLYEYLGKYDKAKIVYERALVIHPNYAQLLKRAAYIALTENDADKAIKNLSSILQVEKDVDFYLLMSEAYSLKKDYNKAVIILMEGLTENPTDTGLLYYLAMQYDLLKERDKAIDTINKALVIAPDNAAFQNFLGYVYVDMDKNLDEAYKLISKALEQNPNNPAYLDSMGWYYFRVKKYDKAYEYIDKALQIAPNEQEIKDHFDAVKAKLNKK